jgi:predicted RNA-binding Zn ribbon-like protein
MTTRERFGPTGRGGPVFRWLGEAPAIDLANTVMIVRDDEAVDLLDSPQALRDWLKSEGSRFSAYSFDPEDLGEIREFRDETRDLLTALAEETQPPSRAIARVNAASAVAPVAPQLAAGPGGELRRADQSAESHSLDWLLGSLARSAIDLLTGTPPGRLKICRAPSCGMFFLGSRRWCCSACGNRARAARHYRRHRQPSVSGSRR